MTLADCKECIYRPRFVQPDARRLLIKNPLSPGDILVMSAAIESLHRQFPGQYITAVDCPCPAIWEHNPWIFPFEDLKSTSENFEAFPTHYPAVHESDQRAIHFMQAYVEWFGDKLKIPLRLQVNRPHLYLSKDERNWIPQVERPFWIVNAGIKKDFTCKGWGAERYQEVVDRLKGKVKFVQVGEKGHDHKPLNGVVDLLGKTDARQFIRLVYHCRGGLGPSTFLQHLCAAFEKPYICLLGGREPVTWVQYPKQTTLHSIGQLDCCRTKACWKSRAIPLGDGKEQDKSLCLRPIRGIPECLARITPERVVEAVIAYET